MAIAKFRKAVIVGIVAVILLVAIGVFGRRSRHNQCCICGVQEYQRSFMGIVVESWCEREYDEYGTYEQWRQMTGNSVCHHEFRLVSEYGFARSLEALSHTKLGLASAGKTITRGMLSDNAYGLFGEIGAKEIDRWSGSEHKSPVETCYLLGDRTCVQVSASMWTCGPSEILRITVGEKGKGYRSRAEWSRQTKTNPDAIVVSKTGLDETAFVKARIARFTVGIKAGMPRKDIEALLAPVTLARAYRLGGAFSGPHMRYRLVGHGELHVDFSFPRAVRTVPTSKWYGLWWDPTPHDVERAAGIAAKQLTKDLAAGFSLAEKYPMRPASGSLDYTVPLTVQHPDGRKLTFAATPMIGRYYTNRIMELQLFQGNRWRHVVWVDLDSREVVPYSWQPTSKDIADARAIAEPTLQEFLGKGRISVTGTAADSPEVPDSNKQTIRLEASGRYDFGPTRRLVELMYSKPDGLCVVLVDIDGRMLFE